MHTFKDMSLGIIPEAIEDAEIDEKDLPIIYFENLCTNEQPDKVVGKRAGIDLKVLDFQSIKGREWFTGEVIEALLRVVATTTVKKVAVVSTFLVPLLEDGINRPLRALKKQIPGYTRDKLIIMPLHLNSNHWALACIQPNSDSIEYYDSLLGHQDTVLLKIAAFFKAIGRIKMIDIIRHKSIPRQWNGCDCGPFTCYFGRALILDLPMDFCQVMMPRIRIEIATYLLEDRAKIEGSNIFRDPYIPLEMFSDDDCQSEADDEGVDDDGCKGGRDDVDDDERVKILSTRMDDIKISDITADQLTSSVPVDCSATADNTVRLTASAIFPTTSVAAIDSHFEKVVSNLDGRLHRISLSAEHEVDLTQPYIAVDEDGQEFTVNTEGDFRRCLKLREVLLLLGGGETGWKMLEIHLLNNPSIGLGWLNRVASGFERTPTSFSFGTRLNFKRVQEILKKVYPEMTIPDLHEKGRKSKKLKPYKRGNPYERCNQVYFVIFAFFPWPSVALIFRHAKITITIQRAHSEIEICKELS